MGIPARYSRAELHLLSARYRRITCGTLCTLRPIWIHILLWTESLERKRVDLKNKQTADAVVEGADPKVMLRWIFLKIKAQRVRIIMYYRVILSLQLMSMMVIIWIHYLEVLS